MSSVQRVLMAWLLPRCLRLHALATLGVAAFNAVVPKRSQRVERALKPLLGAYIACLLLVHCFPRSDAVRLAASLAVPVVFLAIPSLRTPTVAGLRNILDGHSLSAVLLADVWTSYAKVVADWDVLSYWYLLGGGGSAGQGLVSTGLVFAPYALRYIRCRTLSIQRVQALNALKYAASFPTIYLTYLSASRGSLLMNVLLWGGLAFNVAWDIGQDWPVCFFRKLPAQRKRFYLWAVPSNAALRLLWTVRLHVILNTRRFSYGWNADAAIFLVQAGEVLRRMIWIVGRVERQELAAKHSPRDFAQLP